MTGLLDRLLRLAGVLLGLVGGFGTGALVVLLVPLRLADLGWPTGSAAATTRVPLAAVVATGGALFLVWFARRATGWRWAVASPAVGWFAMVVLAVGTSSAGDQLMMPNDWVGTLSLFTGTIVIVVGVVLGVTGTRPGELPGGLPRGGSPGGLPRGGSPGRGPVRGGRPAAARLPSSARFKPPDG